MNTSVITLSKVFFHQFLNFADPVDHPVPCPDPTFVLSKNGALLNTKASFSLAHVKKNRDLLVRAVTNWSSEYT